MAVIPMNPSKDPFGGCDPAASKEDFGATIIRWSDDPGGLPLEECARRGIEAVAGLVISEDVFGTNNYPDATFCTCAEIYHAVTGTSINFDDYIGVNFRLVEIRDGTYPLIGQESVRMAMQPLSDGNISSRWNAINRSSSGRSLESEGRVAEDLDARFLDTRARVGRPLALGPIAEQVEGDASPPSFLILKDPGAGWQIWRRFLHMASRVNPADSRQFREESYIMVYPLFSPEMNWRFRIYDVPGGGIRWEVNSGSRR